MERRRLSRGVYAVVSTKLERDGFLVAFTERTGGVSGPPYRSLNLGFQTGDTEAHVRENRRRAAAALSVDAFASGQQVHGATLVPVGDKRAGAGFEDHAGSIPGADALAVTGQGMSIAVRVADCLPIALASPPEGRLVAVHAGWRGLAAGILERAVSAFDSSAMILAAIGPAIGPCHYEIGEEVAMAVAARSTVGVVTERRGGRLFLDLPRTATRILRATGVTRVELADTCTACERSRFFSHRRDGVTGRQALIAVRM